MMRQAISPRLAMRSEVSIRSVPASGGAHRPRHVLDLPTSALTNQVEMLHAAMPHRAIDREAVTPPHYGHVSSNVDRGINHLFLVPLRPRRCIGIGREREVADGHATVRPFHQEGRRA